MKHLKIGIFVISILILSMHYKVVEINFNLLSKNVGTIAVWIAFIMLGAIVSSWLE